MKLSNVEVVAVEYHPHRTNRGTVVTLKCKHCGNQYDIQPRGVQHITSQRSCGCLPAKKGAGYMSVDIGKQYRGGPRYIYNWESCHAIMSHIQDVIKFANNPHAKIRPYVIHWRNWKDEAVSIMCLPYQTYVPLWVAKKIMDEPVILNELSEYHKEFLVRGDDYLSYKEAAYKRKINNFGI